MSACIGSILTINDRTVGGVHFKQVYTLQGILIREAQWNLSLKRHSE